MAPNPSTDHGCSDANEVGPGASAWTEEELTELALAANLDDPLDEGAVPIDAYLGALPGLLPQWYMPTPMSRQARGRAWRLPVVLAIVAAFVIIEAMGLCSTFGQLVPA